MQILDYLLQLLGPETPLSHGFPRAVFLLTVCALLTALNLRGLQVTHTISCTHV